MLFGVELDVTDAVRRAVDQKEAYVSFEVVASATNLGNIVVDL